MNENIGKFLKQLRKEKRLSQEKLADMIATDRSNISRWENGNVMIPLNQMERICEIFSIQLTELICGERISKDNILDNNKKIIEIVKKENNKFKRTKKCFIISLILLLIIIILFLFYYFFSTYNTQNIYKVSINSSEYKLSDGILVITREEIFFKLGSINEKNMDISIYKNNELKFSGDSNSLLIDYYGYDNYFDTKTLKKDLDNYYIEVDNNRYKLDFIKLYNNKHFIQETLDNISEEEFDNRETFKIPISKKIKEKFECDDNYCRYNDDNYIYMYDVNFGDFTIQDNHGLVISDNFYYELFYSYIDGKEYEVYNNRITCDKNDNDCKQLIKLYDKYYIKMKEKFWD